MEALPLRPLPPISSIYDSSHQGLDWNNTVTHHQPEGQMDFSNAANYAPPVYDYTQHFDPTLTQGQLAPEVVGSSVSQSMPRICSLDSAISLSSLQEMKTRQIGLYTLHEKIGIGMYGAVRRAVHKVTKTEVAIKIIKKNALRPHKNALIRVYREIEVQKRLNHPYVLDIFQVMETDEKIYLVTELCRGGELFNLIQKRKRLSDQEARKYFYQLLLAIQYCHDRGVVHRDIKAENLLLDEFGSIKLADFGFSNFFTDSGMLGTFCGSPQYAAPEVFLGKKYHGPQLDVWSMGVILHVFLTGRTPFEGRNFQQIQERVLYGPIEYPFFVSPEAAQLMNLMMNRKADQRATLRQVMNHRWLKCDDIPRSIRTELEVYHYIIDLISKDPSKECMTELGITETQMRESANRFDNVDGLNRLLVKEYRTRRMRKVWRDPGTINAIIAASLLRAEGKPRVVPVERIDGVPVNIELSAREMTIDQEADNRTGWTKFLPGPEEYPYDQFTEEEQLEKEQDLKEFEKAMDDKRLDVVESLPHPSRSAEIPNFEEAQLTKPSRVDKKFESVDSSEGYGGTGDTSAMSTISPSLSSMVAPDLRRMPSDVCSRMGALDIKRRSIAEVGEPAPLPKRPSLPECLSSSGGIGAHRGALKLADPPKKKGERKNFFELMRLKKNKAHRTDRNCRLENGLASTRPNWFLPPPSLPEGGSFDDTEEIKSNEETNG
ncbi:hypothetical protein PFISCL1PPCAC_27709, partial [Pristionchus fissidentatus]